MSKLKNEDKEPQYMSLKRLDRLNMFERLMLYTLPFIIAMNLFSAFNAFVSPDATTATYASGGFDLLVAGIELFVWFYLFSGRTLSDFKNKNKNK